jgi:hypothetical protein
VSEANEDMPLRARERAEGFRALTVAVSTQIHGERAEGFLAYAVSALYLNSWTAMQIEATTLSPRPFYVHTIKLVPI